MKIAIYARVSTTDKGQDITMQTSQLREYCTSRQWDVFREYIDEGISGSKIDRKALNELLSDARQRKFDIVLVWKLDRFSRSLKDLVCTIQELQELKIDFVSYKDNIDLTTSAGKLMLHIIGAFAEFERDIIKERVKAGLVNARRKGVKLGRPTFPDWKKERILEAKKENPALSIRALAKEFDCTPASVYKTITPN
jgi:DNA invertase Pin-like site-specific DNA recombinase